MLGKFLGKVTGKSVDIVTATPEFVKTNTKATMEALKNAKNEFVSDFKTEFNKSDSEGL
jgi:hypothetical protein